MVGFGADRTAGREHNDLGLDVGEVGVERVVHVARGVQPDFALLRVDRLDGHVAIGVDPHVVDGAGGEAAGTDDLDDDVAVGGRRIAIGILAEVTVGRLEHDVLAGDVGAGAGATVDDRGAGLDADGLAHGRGASGDILDGDRVLGADIDARCRQ